MIQEVSRKYQIVLAAVLLPLIAAAVAYEQWELFLLPFALLTVWVTFYRLDWAMWFIVFSTPLSVNLTDLTGQAGLSLPTEPLLLLVTALTLFKMFFEGKFDKAIITHPISIAIYIYIGWMAFTSLTSQLPLVSLKQLVARIWFIVPYYFVLAHLFKEERNRDKFLWLFLIPLAIAALYTMTVHASHGFTKKTSTWVMFPLFKEHTSYGAVLAMMYPAALYLTFRKSSFGYNAVAAVLLFILTAATILSYTRAAWLSLVGAGMVYVAYVLKLNRSQIWSIVGLVLIVAGFNYSTIAAQFEQNTTDSSDDLNEHVQSVTNVSTDASNLERINRWKSAIRMFEERPVLGHGPGTYMFLYAPYQKPSEKTIISTNAGNRGNAHSEYLGPMAESGFFGLLTVILLISVVVWTATTYYKTLDSERSKGHLRLAFTGLITYYLHGFLNNFLDMDKASAPFWGFTAIIAVLSIKSKGASSRSS